jgi:hypothetical protein
VTLQDWLWLAFATFGPLPLVWAYRRWKAERDARMVRQMMAERRAKFGGFVALPRAKDGRREVMPVERPK